MRKLIFISLVCCGFGLSPLGASADESRERNPGVLPADLQVVRTADVVYGRKHGMALTLDVYAPESEANGIGIVLVVSGGWTSDYTRLNDMLVKAFVPVLVQRGYTVFAVVHGSQPRFTIPEAVTDLNRAVRFIRHHAADYGVDPERIGITGASAGGHLSLMQGTAGTAGDPTADDPVERESSRVQAVACLFPPTDFLNYGEKDRYAFAPDGLLAVLRAVVDVREPDPETHRLERLTNEEQQKVAIKVSPISHVSSDDPPTLIVHGDADQLVPHQQAEAIIAELKRAGVEAKLITRPGRGHDFEGVEADVTAIADWFDAHLGGE